MSHSSRISGFFKMPREQRVEVVQAFAGLTDHQAIEWLQRLAIEVHPTVDEARVDLRQAFDVPVVSAGECDTTNSMQVLQDRHSSGCSLGRIRTGADLVKKDQTAARRRFDDCR